MSRNNHRSLVALATVALLTVELLVLIAPSVARADNLRVSYPLSMDGQNAVAVWNGFDLGKPHEKVNDLGTNPQCSYHDAGGTLVESKCAVVVSTSPRGGTQLVFSPPPPHLAWAVLVENTKTNYTLEIPIETCSFSGVEPFATLYAGATMQLLRVAASSATCAHRLKVQANLDFVAGNTRAAVQVIDEEPEGAMAQAPAMPAEEPPSIVTLSVTDLPATLGDTWTIVSALEPSLGTLNVRTAANPIAVATDENGAPVLGVHYEADFFEQRHTPKSVAGNAVLTASEQSESAFLYVRNQPKLSVTGLDALLRQLQQQRITTCQCEREDEDEDYKCEYHSNPWKVETLTWHDSAWIRYPEGLNPERAGTREPTDDGKCAPKVVNASPETAALTDERSNPTNAKQPARKSSTKRSRYTEGWAHGEVLLEALDDLTFSVFQAEVQSFEVMVTLRDPAHPERTLFATKVKLASAARRESIPLPIKDMLFVACGDLGEAAIIPEIAGFAERLEDVDIVLNGTTRAINEDDLKAGQCFLQYSPSRSSDAIHQKGQRKRDTIGSLVHFGRQEIEVVLRRGASEKKVLWTLDPTREQSIPLPQPADSKETGVYVAQAVVRGPMPPEVVYRPAAPVNATERPIIALGDLEFKASLRPRGRFGWVMFPIRTFVTIPVELAGFRLPANARELESSSTDSSVQIVTGRTGWLVALEPWDYDRGVNPWPVPARLMAGMSLFRLGEGRFVPSLMNGVQFSFPVLDLPKGSAEDQLGTDASLGFFWEHDLQDGGGDHLMITVGANLLTLFGSK